MDEETCITLWYLVKNFFYIFDHFFGIISNLPGTQTLKVISLLFFNKLALHNWAMKMDFNPVSIIQGLFVGRGVGRPPPPRLYIDSDPPAFTVLMLSIFLIKGNPLSIRNISTFYVRQRDWVFAPNSNFLISISFQPDVINLWYLKLRLIDLTDFIVWNI